MALKEDSSVRETFEIISSSGLYEDGWTGPEALLSFASDEPISLYFFLPIRPEAPQTKRIKLYGNDTKAVIEVERGKLTACAPFAPVNGKVAVQIYCDELEPSSQTDQRKLGLLLARVSGNDGSTLQKPSLSHAVAEQDVHENITDEGVSNLTLNDAPSDVVDANESADSLNTFEASALEPLFDKEFYLSGFSPNEAPTDPISHFLSTGWQEGREPAPWFSSHHYRALHPDVAAVGMNPFLHYCLAGKTEGRKLARLGHDGQGDAYRAHAFAVEPGPLFEEFDPSISVGRRKRAKVLAYYLPQFHRVEVNETHIPQVSR